MTNFNPSHRPMPYEADLRNHVAKNLHLLEPGLRLYERRPGSIEFPCAREGRIDVLATDAQRGLLVIECKNKVAQPDALGQLLGYIAWLIEQIPTLRGRVRGAIVAQSASPSLLRAIRLVPEVPILVFEFHRPARFRRVA